MAAVVVCRLRTMGVHPTSHRCGELNDIYMCVCACVRSLVLPSKKAFRIKAEGLGPKP